MIDAWLQEKYILLLSNRLERFKRVSSGLFNFRCPICGDSEKSKVKARGYLYKRKDSYFYHCKNCNKPGRFENILKELDPNLYYEMKKEAFGSEYEATVFEQTYKKIGSNSSLDHLPTIASLTDKHPAKKYIKSRKIPEYKLEELLYCEDFKALVDSIEKDKLKSEKHAIPRIIIPFYDRNNELFGFQGRAVDPEEEVRYISIILDDSKPKAYNLNNIDPNKKYYVFEGPFDAMFIDNSMAVCGSDVLSVLNSSNLNKENAVIVFDNEPRNPDIVRNVNKAIEFGWTICIWPEYWEEKDINDAILKGTSASEINAIIDLNTYSGTIAKLKYSQWRKE